MVNTSKSYKEEQEKLGYGELFGILWFRRFWFLGTFISILAIALVVVLKKSPIYKSSMQLLIDSYYEDQSQDLSTDFTESKIKIDYATQVSLMRSSGLLQTVVDALQSEYPEFTISELKESFTLRQILEDEQTTNIILAQYTSEDAVKAQKVIEILQKVYQDYNLEQQQQRKSNGLSFINEQVEIARANLIEAELELQSFRQKNSLVSPLNEADTMTDNLNNIEQAQKELQADYQENQARYNQLRATLGASSPEVLLTVSRLSQSDRYQALLNQIQEIEVTLATESVRFADGHPMLQGLEKQRRNLQQLLEQERQKALGAFSSQPRSENSRSTEQQLSSTDLNLINEMMQAQLNLLSLEARQQSLKQSQENLQQDLNRFPSLISDYDILAQKVEVRRSVLEQLLQAQQELGIEINRTGFNWQVVEEPLVEQIGPDRIKGLLLGGVVALFLGGGAAFLREAGDDVIHTCEQLKKFPLPFLGATPQYNQFLNQVRVSLPWRQQPPGKTLMLQLVLWQPFREAVDLVYQKIQLFRGEGSLNSIAVTSAIAGEGKSTLVLGLALSAARLQQRVLVIDANLRTPIWHQHLELSNEQGLSTLLNKEIDNPMSREIYLSNLLSLPRERKKNEVFQSILLSGSHIDVLTTGSVFQDSVNLLGSRTMKELVQLLEQHYDLVLFDIPPILGTVDAIQVASLVDGVVMIAELDRITQFELFEATALLDNLPLLGIVANRAKK